MKFAPLCFCAGLASLSVLSAASPASAFIAGINLTGGQTILANDAWTLGWEFNVNRPINIDALGIFDAGAPGLNGSYTLGLWDLGGNLLASTAVSGVGDGIENGFIWKSLASVLTLAPGNYVVGAAGDYLVNNDEYALDGTFQPCQVLHTYRADLTWVIPCSILLVPLVSAILVATSQRLLSLVPFLSSALLPLSAGPGACARG